MILPTCNLIFTFALIFAFIILSFSLKRAPRLRLARPVIPVSGRVRMLTGKQDSGTHRIHHQFLFFFSGDKTAPPLRPLRWAPEVPWPSACGGITPCTPPSPTCEEPRSFSAQPQGTQTGTETPSAAARSCPGPAPASSRLMGERGAEQEGPRASPSLTKHLHSAPSGRGGGGGGLGPGPGPSSENGPFGGITFSPWTLQMPPLRPFKDLGMG